MTTKLLTYYTKLFEFGKLEYVTESVKMYDYFQYFLDYNYSSAEELWDYVITTSQAELKSSQAAILLADHVLALFIAKSEQKAAKLITENISIRAAVYQLSPNPHTWFPLTVLVNLIMSGKLVQADEILKPLSRNTAIEGGFGAAMGKVVEAVISQLIAKSAGKPKVEMSKKLSKFLLEYITKLKGASRSLLEQRIKEVS